MINKTADVHNELIVDVNIKGFLMRVMLVIRNTQYDDVFNYFKQSDRLNTTTQQIGDLF